MQPVAVAVEGTLPSSGFQHYKSGVLHEDAAGQCGQKIDHVRIPPNLPLFFAISKSPRTNSFCGV